MHSQFIETLTNIFIALFVQPDRRSKKKRWRLSSGCSSIESSPTHKAMEVIASPLLNNEEESDLDILGFYPSFDQNNALVCI